MIFFQGIIKSTIKSLKNQKRSETYVSDPVGMELMFTLWHSPLHGKSAKHHSYTETGLCSSTGTSVWMARSKAKLRWAKAPVQSKQYQLPTWFPQNKLGHRIATTHTQLTIVWQILVGSSTLGSCSTSFWPSKWVKNIQFQLLRISAVCPWF